MRPYARFTLFLLVLTATLVWIAWGGAVAQTGDSSTAQFNRGILLYQRYCSNCHGDQAHGDGRIAHLLKTEPADLTQLIGEDGRFPADEVRKTIDGRAGRKSRHARAGARLPVRPASTSPPGSATPVPGRFFLGTPSRQRAISRLI